MRDKKFLSPEAKEALVVLATINGHSGFIDHNGELKCSSCGCYVWVFDSYSRKDAHTISRAPIQACDGNSPVDFEEDVAVVINSLIDVINQQFDLELPYR